MSDYVCLDTETCGFFGPVVLLQYGEGDDGPIILHSPFKSPIDETLSIIEHIFSKPILGFNLAFDIFKLCQAYTTLLLLKQEVGGDELPEDHIDEYALCEPAARDGPCLKPPSAMDLMLHARKGPWQNLMARDDLIVRRVPAQMAQMLADELEKKISIPEIFFAKRKKHEKKWKVEYCRGTTDWCNVVLRFAPASGLKPLYAEEFGISDILKFKEVDLDSAFQPVENGFAPFALSVGRPGKWRGSWPDVIKYHVSHWSYNPLAREYAQNDIKYPRELWHKWGRPAFGDDDSMLACLAGAARWKGYAVDLAGIKQLADDAANNMTVAPRAPGPVMAWIKQVLTPEEQVVLIDPKTGSLTTKKVVLEEISKFKECRLCRQGVPKHDCVLSEHPAAERARLVLTSRKAKKEKEIYDKLLLAGRFHVSVNVIGTRSSRQSGGQVSEGKKAKKSGGLNPQGIQKKKVIRAKFPLAFSQAVINTQGMTENNQRWAELGFEVSAEALVGGDFDSFEVCITDAYYDDPQLHHDLVAPEVGPDGKPTGKIQKIHAVVGTLVYPHNCGETKLCKETRPRCPKPHDYWSIRATDGQDPDLYTRAKSALFALIYFGNEKTLAERLGIPLDDGEEAYRAIMTRYPVMGEKRQEFFERFCPLRQPGGIGTKVEWKDPDEKVESMLGFARYFTLENKIIRAIYDLAEHLPPRWKEMRLKVQRRDRMQTMHGAVQSALFAAAFAIQGANMRAAGNHVIQSTGAGLTKILQRRIWDLQPAGIHSWVIRPMNVHDELPTAVAPQLRDKVAEIQKSFIEEYRKVVPLLGMKWKNLENWAGK